LGHPLVESMGRQGRDFELQLAGVPAREEVEAYVEPAGVSALATLQRDLLDCAARGEGGPPRVPFPAHDESLRVHACHGALRQVEVLRDELLRCLDEMPGLQPRDVLVLTPDVERFAPLIEAVFAAPTPAGQGAPRVPFRVADRPVLRENPVAEAVLRYLALVGGRLDAASVLELLAVPTIARRFRLHTADRDTLRRWVDEGGIRWGIDAEHRKEHQVPAAPEHCWRFGFDRLLVGQAMAGEGRDLFEGVLPYDEIEGREAELLGRFVDACERLFARSRELSRARPVAAWRDALSVLAGELVDESDDALAWSLHGFRAVLETLAADAAAAGHDGPVELAAVRLLLDRHFGEAGSASGFGSGAVTFCALLPGRPVPARVVALLGMDDGAFPRQRTGAGFDLAAREPHVGDADPNADDRQRFLEAVMGAGERLILTYTGRSTSTNEAIPPAVPVGELLDALDATFTVPAAPGAARAGCRPLVMRQHPLQPFAPANFRAGTDGTPPPSYDRTWLAAAVKLERPRRAPRPFVASPLPSVARDDTLVVTVGELARFFEAPGEALLRGRLRLSLGARDAEVAPREPAELEGRQRWDIRRDLLERALAGDDVSRALTVVRASGRLPHGAVGELAFEALLDEVHRLRDARNEAWTTEPRDPVAVDFAAHGVRLVGAVGGLQESGQLHCQPGQVQDRHLVALWVRHLAASVMLGGAPFESVLVAMPTGRARGFVTRIAPVDDAATALAALLELYALGQHAPLPFFPATSRAFATAMAGGDEGDPEALVARAIDAARKRWLPTSTWTSGSFDGEDRYVRRAFGDAEPFADAASPHSLFRRAALGVWRPLDAAIGSRGARRPS
jgi:exodeoxyribonuclease V gamma subunit